MHPVILVAVGGAIGAITRYKLGGLILHHSATWKFPLSTFVVNVTGCLVAGILAGLVIRHELFAADLRIFLFTGLLGGFTTFSAFGLETVHLLQRQEFGVAFLNVFLSTVVGVAVLWLGIKAIP